MKSHCQPQAKMLPDAYGCVVANRFGDLLDDEADPFDLIGEVQMEKEKKKKKKDEEDKKAKQKKPGQKESQKDRRVRAGCDGQDPFPVRKQQQPQQQQHARSTSVTESREDREEAQRGMKRPSAVQRRVVREENPPEFSVPKPYYDADTESRGRGGFRGRRGLRGGGYTRNQDNFNLRGKREYDRHNGTGISPEEKRGGRGPWNWGCVDEASSELMEVKTDTPVKSEEPQGPAEEEGLKGEGDEEDAEMVVQVAVEMTLDEWKALQETSRPKAEFNIRKGEEKIPSKAKVIHQSKRVETIKGTMEDIEDEGNFLRKSVNDITSLLDINFGSLGRPNRGGRGRGARGGQGTRPERVVKPMLERDDVLAPNIDDPEDFPALSGGR
ncbi:intracellular hyaluronan-binding protein 4-like isoform X2 [Mugil cephalus]|uniref:intracellular hyaluronan-binding protein 4-like isoform X2 n=1 Tax=Mugil cephalus TaxID=48193 RepID=UPI001FB856D0|nr:intracellular hyaluronan-binding protein 4-like isoform X2 [Mugil cephalus]